MRPHAGQAILTPVERERNPEMGRGKGTRMGCIVPPLPLPLKGGGEYGEHPIPIPLRAARGQRQLYFPSALTRLFCYQNDTVAS